MTDFKTISGHKIKFLTSDLTAGTATEGELFYSDSDKEFKIAIHSQAWASGGNLNTTRRGLGGAGTQTAGMACAGFVSTFPVSQVTEEYAGSSWTNGENMGSGH